MLSPTQKRFLKAAAHNLKPIVHIGQRGLEPSVINELDQALTFHELLKVKLVGADRESREALITAMCTATQAEAVQHIGQMAVLFRRNHEKTKITLPAK